MTQSAVVRRVQMPISPAYDRKRFQSYVARIISKERLLHHAMQEIIRQLTATSPLMSNDKSTGQWVQIGEKPDTRARQWAVDRILDLAGAYPPKEQPDDDQRDQARAKLRELIEQHKGEPVEVLKFRWETGRWPDARERAKLLDVPRETLPVSPIE